MESRRFMFAAVLRRLRDPFVEICDTASADNTPRSSRRCTAPPRSSSYRRAHRMDPASRRSRRRAQRARARGIVELDLGRSCADSQCPWRLPTMTPPPSPPCPGPSRSRGHDYIGLYRRHFLRSPSYRNNRDSASQEHRPVPGGPVSTPAYYHENTPHRIRLGGQSCRRLVAPPAQPTARPGATCARPTPSQQAATGATDEKPVSLSPFTVSTTRDSGYFAENTLAGSRLNTNLADLASSITVVTKQQMDDTASLDINDVFKYEASTEGSSSYTPSITDRGTTKDTVAGYTLRQRRRHDHQRAVQSRARPRSRRTPRSTIIRRTTAFLSTATTRSRSKSAAVRTRCSSALAARRASSTRRRPGGAQPQQRHGQRPH